MTKDIYSTSHPKHEYGPNYNKWITYVGANISQENMSLGNFNLGWWSNNYPSLKTNQSFFHKTHGLDL